MFARTAHQPRTTGSRRSPGMRRLRPVSWPGRFTILAGLAATGAILATAAPASADNINLAATSAIAGTNCSVTVGTDQNPSAYPGTATQVTCSSPHTITVTTQLQDASLAGGLWYLYGQTPTDTTYAYATRMLFYHWQACPACRWQWRVVAFVTIDGVYHGGYANARASWTACTYG